MDGSPQTWNLAVKRLDLGGVGEIDIVHQPDAIVGREGEVRRRRGMGIGDMADGALTQQLADNRAAESPGAAGHHNMLAIKCLRHLRPLLLFFYAYAAPVAKVAPFA